jgi:hypothetical protein
MRIPMMKQQQLANLLAARLLLETLPIEVQKMIIARVMGTGSYDPDTRLRACLWEVHNDVNKLPWIDR